MEVAVALVELADNHMLALLANRDVERKPGRHAGFETGRNEGLARDNAGNCPVEGAKAQLHRSIMALSMTQRPFVLEKIQGVVCACGGGLQTALGQPLQSPSAEAEMNLPCPPADSLSKF